MHYVVMMHGLEYQVDIVESRPNNYRIAVTHNAADARVFEVDAHEVATGAWSLLIGNQSFCAYVEGEQHDTVVHLAGANVPVDVLDLRRANMRRVKSEAMLIDGPLHVVAPMAGKIINILVQEGDMVIVGQPLIVIEAMKMENELRATRAGKVCRMLAKLHSSVENGTVLCDIEV